MAYIKSKSITFYSDSDSCYSNLNSKNGWYRQLAIKPNYSRNQIEEAIKKQFPSDAKNIKIKLMSIEFKGRKDLPVLKFSKDSDTFLDLYKKHQEEENKSAIVRVDADGDDEKPDELEKQFAKILEGWIKSGKLCFTVEKE